MIILCNPDLLHKNAFRKVLISSNAGARSGTGSLVHPYHNAQHRRKGPVVESFSKLLAGFVRSSHLMEAEQSASVI